MFDVYYMGGNNNVKEHIPFAKEISTLKDINAKTKMYWVIEPNIEVIDYDVFEFRPEAYDQTYEHVWKWDSKNYGGIRLLPTKEVHGVKEVNKVVCKKRFDMLHTKTPGKYFENNLYATHVWCVDPGYKLSDDINWAPDNFEPDYIHSFHLRGQLEHKYPAEEGGVKLFPRDWKNAGIKYHTFLDANAVYPVIYVSNVDDYSQRDVFNDEYVWLIDSEHRVNPTTIDWVPNPFEEGMIHSFRMPYQLTEKYPMAMGGIRLVPRNWKISELKIHPACPIEDESYDVFYVDEDEFTAETYNECSERSKTEWFWVVDREFQFNGKLLYVPAKHEIDFIHVFKLPGHLEERYPFEFTEPWDNRCGGIRLVNKNYDLTKHKYQPNVVPVRYDIFYVNNPSDFAAPIKKSRTKMCWVIDQEYSINNVLKYVPTKDEQKYLLNFKITDQLLHKYPEQEGGIYLVPKTFNVNTSIKYKGAINVHKKEYPVLFVDDVTDYSIVTEDCWLIDKEYQIDDDIDWSPSTFEISNVHTFHVPNQLEHKYPEEMGGVRWVPLNRTDDVVIHKDLPVKPKKYPIHFVTDPNDYSQAKGECWLIDKEYLIDQDIEWLPSNFEKSFIHTFHVDGQLLHKYPEEIGGVRWVPLHWEDANTKIHTESPFTKPVFERYSNEEEGRQQTTKDWFWVVDSNIDVLDDFDFTYIPAVWDAGKTHVWQKLNPITERQYDYDGIKLCPKVPAKKGRPKYIRKPACIHKPYPIYYLEQSDYTKPLNEAYRRFESTTDVDMYWVVDAYTQVDPDFKFDYYPTQWDKHNVHVFANEDGEHTNVRLVPVGTFTATEYTDKEIANNSFENLKLNNTVASLRPKWPVIYLQSVEKAEFTTAIKDIKEPFVWTVDPDVKADEKLLDRGYMPKITDTAKVHTWQRQTPHTERIHSYGGLRLWPTANDYSDLTTDALELNKIRDLHHVRNIGSSYKPYDVMFISYKEPDAESAYERLKQRCNAQWVRDVKGIFNAHQRAAEIATSKMFWVVDADADVTEEFDFNYIPDVYDQDVVHVWNSINPVTGMEYGYGGVKLFNREQVLAATSWGLDFTTGLSNRFKAMPEISCITRFNTDAFSTWRSAFRECVKLTLKDDTESVDRLESWLHPVPDADFRHDAKRGAEEGREFATKNKNNAKELAKINDYDWLKKYYAKHKS